MNDKDFSYNIEKEIATIADYKDGTSLRLNLISYRGTTAKYDLRKWDKATNRMLKGITFTEEEKDKIINALTTLKGATV